ncbi:MAG: amidohydrolase/deacetylase family metallohydrolase [Opitutaceae bacterium]|nr:amidohydrolase/deacetylase family metallohydrolase [Opitutaceae bacterium]
MNRRTLLRMALWTPVVCANWGRAATGGRPAAPEPVFDLLLKGGRVIDPAQALDAVRDIAVLNGRIAAVEPEIDAEKARRSLDLRGRMVTPGLIDLHVHGFQGISVFGLDLDPYCINRGVTTAVDAGTSGGDSFEGFRRQVIERSATRVLAFLNISRIGLIVPLGELIDARMIDRVVALRTARANADVIVGIKVRCSEFYSGPNDLDAVKAARAVGEAIQKPLMIHVGWPHTGMETILEQARPGDIVTHAFRGRGEGGVVGADGHVSAYIRRAADRGVLFDVGHGSGSFSFAAAEAALRENFLPSTISSDIHSGSVLGPAFDLVTTMSKFLLLGLSLPKVVELVTAAPARAIGRGETLGALKPGRPADIAVFDRAEGNFPLVDSKKEIRVAHAKLVPVFTLRDGTIAPRPESSNPGRSV